MRIPPLPRALLLLGLLMVALGFALPAGAADERYPANLAWRLITEREIQDLTGCPQALGGEETEAAPLFPPPEIPLEGIEAARGLAPVLVRPPSQWDVAPFPTLDPPPPSDLPESARAAREAEPPAPEGPRPDVFGDISTETREAPSAELRPRTTTVSDALVTPDSTLPVPFSLRRYHTKDRGFFQIALYGGDSGIAAERHYRTLHSAAPNRKPVSGVGDEAFVALLPRPAPEAPPAPEPARPAFGDIEPVGEKRLDLVDEGLAKARSAPAFQTIPTNLGIPDGLRKDKPQEPTEDPLDKEFGPDPFGGAVTAPGGGVQVLVAFFPSKGVVLEIAMDDRVGDTQNLMRLAFMVQSRLLQRW